MGMGIGATGKKGRSAPEMNVTPLVDVVLVLLIIFMVVTPMMAKQFWLAVPDKPKVEEPPPADAKPPVVVTVGKDGKIRINRDVVTDSEFEPRLHRVLAAKGDRTIVFDAHDEAPFERASQALDMARAAGAATIAVATDAMAKD